MSPTSLQLLITQDRHSVAMGAGLIESKVLQPACFELHLLSEHGNYKPGSEDSQLVVRVVAPDSVEVLSAT